MNPNVAPAVTPPSPNEWPSTIRYITHISNDAQAVVTAPNHGFTSSDQGLAVVDFLLVRGMLQINGLPGVVQQVLDANQFTVNVNTTNFGLYRGGGQASIIAGLAPYDPFQNIA